MSTAGNNNTNNEDDAERIDLCFLCCRDDRVVNQPLGSIRYLLAKVPTVAQNYLCTISMFLFSLRIE